MRWKALAEINKMHSFAQLGVLDSLPSVRTKLGSSSDKHRLHDLLDRWEASSLYIIYRVSVVLVYVVSVHHLPCFCFCFGFCCSVHHLSCFCCFCRGFHLCALRTESDPKKLRFTAETSRSSSRISACLASACPQSETPSHQD